MVGEAIGKRLIELGHEVMMGSRSESNEKSSVWVEKSGENARAGTFTKTANFADEIVFNCTKGEFAIDALNITGKEALRGKTLIDVSNPLDFSNGMPPTLSICNDNSLAEEIQKAFPACNVVKSLNTMTASIMLNPGKIQGDHCVFLSGNNEDSKSAVGNLLKEAGWKKKNIIDLGDITTARGAEMLLPIWIRLWGALGHADFNFNINREKAS